MDFLGLDLIRCGELNTERLYPLPNTLITPEYMYSESINDESGYKDISLSLFISTKLRG